MALTKKELEDMMRSKKNLVNVKDFEKLLEVLKRAVNERSYIPESIKSYVNGLTKNVLFEKMHSGIRYTDFKDTYEKFLKIPKITIYNTPNELYKFSDIKGPDIYDESKDIIRDMYNEMLQFVEDIRGNQTCEKCHSSCVDNCAINCYSECIEICSSGCSIICGASCERSCYNKCRSGCGKNCGSGCKGNCKSSCGSNGCTGCYGCGGCGPGGDCIWKCGGCGENCSSGCYGGCNGCGGCSGNCDKEFCSFDKCIGKCNVNCNKNYCRSECSDRCHKKCSYICYDSYCDIFCEGSCKNSCYSSCYNNCKGFTTKSKPVR